MNILMVSPNVVVGGAQKILLYLARGLEKRGHRVFIFTTHLDLSKLPNFASDLTYIVNDEKILQPGGQLSNYTSIENPGLLLLRLIRLRKALKRLVERYDIDVVNPHNPPANWICSFLEVPNVWSCHNNPISFYANLRRGYTPLSPDKRGPHHIVAELFYEGVDYAITRYGISHIVALSDRIAREIAKVYRRESEVIIFVPASEDAILRHAGRNGTKFGGLETGPLVLLQVGQLNEFKRPMFSLDVVETVRRQIPDVRLMFVGDGALRPALEREIVKRGLEGVVSLLGLRDEVELSEIYVRAHVLLFPGIDQPLGIVPIEAVWNSVVPIVADSSGVASLMEQLGIITLARPTVEAFADRVVHIYEHRKEMDEWLRVAQEILAREFSYDAFLDRYERCFGSAAAVVGPRRRRP